MKIAVFAVSALFSGCMTAGGDVQRMESGVLTVTGDSRGITSSMSTAHSKAVKAAETFCAQTHQASIAVRFEDSIQLNEYATTLTFKCGNR